jgi:hypothetical protein
VEAVTWRFVQEESYAGGRHDAPYFMRGLIENNPAGTGFQKNRL